MFRIISFAWLTLSLGAFANPIIVDLSSGDLTGQFLGTDGATGWVLATEGNNEVLFRTDGTTGGTVRVRNFVPVGGFRAAVSIFPVPPGMAFVQSNNSIELTDGTTAPFVRLGTTTGRLFSAGLVAQGKAFFMMVVDATSPLQLLVSDRTAAGTHVVTGVSIYRSGISPTAVVGSQIYFVSSNGDVGVTDGVVTSTFFPRDSNRVTRAVYGCGGQLYIVSLQGGQNAVYVSTPPSAPVLLKPPGTLSMTELICSPMGALFSGFTAGFGNELWRTDGTEAGTAMVHDVNVGSGSGFPSLQLVPHIDGGVHFSANDGTTGQQVWFSAGDAGAVRVTTGSAHGLLRAGVGEWAFYQSIGNIFMVTETRIVPLNFAIQAAGTSGWGSFPAPIGVGSKLISFGSGAAPYKRDQLWVFDPSLPFAFDDGGVDAGMPDAGMPDAGMPDAGMPDAGMPDAGMPDAGMPDAGMPDAGMPDAGMPDAGMPDAGMPDAGTPDAGTPDAGTPAPDAGSLDAGVGAPAKPSGCGCDGAPGLLPMALSLLALRRRQRGSA